MPLKTAYTLMLKKADKVTEAVVKAEPEQKVVKRVNAFVKAKNETVLEMPKKSELASTYPRLADIYHKLGK